MAIEIERKFLLKNDNWKKLADAGTSYKQGYLVGSEQASVRVRIQGDKAYLNIKSATLGVFRNEYEYEIPLTDANEMLENLCHKPLIIKKRHLISVSNHTWEIDVFEGDNSGLTVAEIELQTESEDFELPDWIGEEVSHDTRYYNVCLVDNPYKNWK